MHKKSIASTNHLGQSATIYVFSTLIKSSMPFLLLPILTRYLSQEEYGQIAMFQTLVIGLSCLIGFSVHNAANRKYFDNIKDKECLKKFNGACIQILMISMFLILILSPLYINKLSLLLSIRNNWIYLAIIVSVFTFVIQMRLGQWQIRDEPLKFGFLQIIQSFISVCLTLILVIMFVRGEQGRIESQVIVASIFFLISMYTLFKDDLIALKRIYWAQIKEALKFGIPLIPHVMGGFIVICFDRVVINNKLGLEATGIYMVAVQLSAGLGILYSAFHKAYIPWLFKHLKQKNSNHEIVKLTYVHFFVSFTIILLSFLIGPSLVVFIAGEKYKSAGEIIGWLCLGQCFNGMFYMFSGYILYSKKTKYLSQISVFSGSMNLILIYPFINQFGIKGAALAYAISSMISFFLSWYRANRMYPMPWY